MLRHWFAGSLITGCCLISLWSVPVDACGLGDAIRNRRSLPDLNRVTYPTATLPQKMNGAWEGDQQALTPFGKLLRIAQSVTHLNLSQVIWASREVSPPGMRHDAARRCGSAPHAGYPIVALVPEQTYGQTLAAAPKLFIYVPPTLGLRAEFWLNSPDDPSGLTKEFTLPEESGIIIINLAMPDRHFSLEPGKLYEWDFIIPVDPVDRSGDVVLQGWIERIEPEPELTTVLAHSSNPDRLLHLAQAGLWYDTLTTLYDLRQTNPTNIHYSNGLRQVLESVDLGYLADKPVIAEF